MGRNTLDRRKLLLASLGAVLPASSEPSRLETLSDWFHASSSARKAGLQDCLERIKVADPSIRAWVQVLPQEATGRGMLSGIPFGAKDIIETRGLSTEYGSPIYKGRVGTADAAIIKDLRGRGAILLGKTETTGFRVSRPCPHAQSTQLGTYTGRKFEWIGGCRGRRHGALRAGNPDHRFNGTSSLLLRHYRVQGHLRAFSTRRCPSLCQKPRHAWVLYSYTCRHAPALGGPGPFHLKGRGFFHWRTGADAGSGV